MLLWKTRRVSVGSVLEHSVARKAKQELHVALIGAGRIARGEHLLAWRNFSGTRVVAIADPSPEALETIGRQFSIARRVGDYRELLDDQQIDVIDICAPSALHAEMTIAAIRTRLDGCRESREAEGGGRLHGHRSPGGRVGPAGR